MPSSTSNVLPVSFTPGTAHIIIGRGRVVKLHAGNRKLDKMVAAIANEYSAATGKAEKGMILSRLIDEIDDAAPDAGFVKRDPVTGRWYTVEESLARTTCAQALRNYLNGEYRSSKQYKQKRRLEQIQQEMMGTSASGFEGATIKCDSEVARCVSPLPTPAHTETSEEDSQTFDILFAAFGNNVTGNPLAPRPISLTHPLGGPKIVRPKTTVLMPRLVASVTPPTSSQMLNKLASNLAVLRASAVAV